MEILLNRFTLSMEQTRLRLAYDETKLFHQMIHDETKERTNKTQLKNIPLIRQNNTSSEMKLCLHVIFPAAKFFIP